MEIVQNFLDIPYYKQISIETCNYDIPKQYLKLEIVGKSVINQFWCTQKVDKINARTHCLWLIMVSWFEGVLTILQTFIPDIPVYS